ncbi:two-component response regulator (plasmid) [Azospirillum sp. B510]|uniref:response regulator transcription factor n=1 Tax=Azospirillum sp. (strain B510) TaxID=137722 RepID=UPI0001C4C766|nr:response regulator [Azospirillum sp. B510]BAI75589.1 two-component response regulator [Azospirillum sp. B510]
MQSVPTICVVDDDEAIRESLDNFLRSVGMRVRTFSSAEEFIAYEGETACLVTDLNLKGMDGFSLQMVLLQLGRRHPVIVMTAFATPAARNRSLAQGAFAFVTKPLDPENLLLLIEDAVGNRQGDREP